MQLIESQFILINNLIFFLFITENKMNSYLFITIIGLTICGLTIGQPISNDDDNSLTSNPSNESKDSVVIVPGLPPTYVSQPIGTTIELVCEAVGNPAPKIQWIRGNEASINVC